MSPLICTMPTLAVSAIYCLWRLHAQHLHRQRRRVLSERVAYMLWVMAERVA